MKQGGGAGKGALWERTIGTDLSLWITDGTRADLFSRNVLSGGRFTLASKNNLELGNPGDLAPSHPLAFEFMSLFMVEAKHYKNIGLDKYLLDQAGKTFLAKTFELASEQSKKIDVHPLVIAKQNHCPAIVMMQYQVGLAAIQCARTSGFRYHIVHNNTVVICLFQQLKSLVRIKPFLEIVKNAKTGA